VTAIPQYNPVTAPFAVAANDASNKILLLNTATGATIVLALLKQNHQDDMILPEYIKVSGGCEESKSASEQDLIVHFVT